MNWHDMYAHAGAGLPTLVHCKGGVSRSATLLIAYLMYSGAHQALQELHQVKRVTGVVASIRRPCKMLRNVQ